MNTRRTFLAALFLVATLASCGGQSAGSDTTSARKRNATLTNEVPVITSIEPGADSLTVHVGLPGGTPPNTWFYQLATDTPGAVNPVGNGTATVRNAPESFVIPELTTGADYVVRVAHWNGETSDYAVAHSVVGIPAPTTTPTTIPATTTTTVSCRTGGDCAIGDTGPGGGTVFYDAGSDLAWGRYLEAAPVDITATQFGCLGATPSASLSGIGEGRANTDEIALGTCGTGTAAKAVTAYALGSVNDWYMPTKAELNELCKYARSQKTGDAAVACAASGALRNGFSSTFYWSSTEAGNDLASIQNFVTGYQLNYGKPAPAVTRPVRAFTNKNGATVATTIAPPPCKRGGTCVVGDTGPGGGVVFYVAPTKQAWGQYMEITTGPVATGLWGCESNKTLATSYDFARGAANTVTLVGLGCSAAIAADNYVSPTGLGDWFLPSDAEMSTALATGKVSGQSNSIYWTSSASPGCDLIGSTLYCWARTRSPGNGWTNSSRDGYAQLIHAVRAFSAKAA